MLTKKDNQVKTNEEKDQNVIVPGIGEYQQCVKLIESENDISKLTCFSETIDSYFGVENECTVETLMRTIIKDYRDDRDMIVLSGYCHLLLAERLYKEKLPKKIINRQIKKAEALLDYANLGGRHPLLPRTMRLKRRVNWKAYTKLGITIIALLLLICFIGYLYGKIKDLDFDIL